MSVKSVVSGAIVLALGAAAYGIYAPDQVAPYWPQAAVWARQARASLPLPQPAATAAAAKPDAAPAVAAVPVEAQPAALKDFPVVLESLGQVAAYNTVTVKARVDGQVTRIAFKEGQMVNQGDLLAEIDARPFQAALDQARGKRQQDEANLANAKLDQGRYATLAKQSYATQQQLDTQTALVNQLTGQIAADTAAIDAAQVQLGYTRITAPLTGRVGYRLIDQGNMVMASAQTGIVVIDELQPISVNFTAPEEQVGEINALTRAGDAKVEVKTTDGQPLSVGVLEVVDNHVDAATGTVKLKARFGNEDQKLWPGLAVIADLTLGVDRQAVVVPAAAVQHSQRGLFVYVVGDDNKVDARPIKVAHETIDEAAVASGLKAGERVVTLGQSMLRPGALAAVQNPGPRS